MGDIFGFIQQHGQWIYPLTVVGTFLEGETFVLLAAAASTALRLDPVTLGLCAWFGSAAGDQSWFFAGRSCGPWILRRSAKVRAGIGVARRLIERWDALFILSYRFMYGIRNVSSIALGMSDVSSQRFIFLNTIAAGLWAVVFVGAGVLFGSAAAELLGRWASTIEIVLAILFFALVVAAGLFSRDTPLPVAQVVPALRSWIASRSRRS
jgi:membrane protein DedA with SNARE-associated domain